MILITGRSTKQGTGISTGKSLDDYQQEIRALELSSADMARLGVKENDPVKLKTAHGEAVAICREADLPEGMVFMAFGPITSLLVGEETHASGMPDTKGLEVEIERVAA